LTLWHQTRAVNDVLGYAQAENDWEIERQTYRVLFPRMGAESTGIAGPLVSTMVAGPVAPLLVAPALHMSGAAVGHIAGRSLIARRDAELHGPNSPAEEPSDVVQQVGYIDEQAPAQFTVPAPER